MNNRMRTWYFCTQVIQNAPEHGSVITGAKSYIDSYKFHVHHVRLRILSRFNPSMTVT